MFLNVITLITAISISIVAGFYSIVGLASIFSGAVLPIIIMGGVLEFGKIVTTVWLHMHWRDLNWPIRAYLASAVIVLMFITSLGIFGFLSKAHLETTGSVADNQLLIERLDQTIAIEQKRIDDNRAQVLQLDSAVSSLLQNSAANAQNTSNRTSQMAQQATKLRQSQRNERAALNTSTDESNKRIQELNSQKLKLQQEQAKVEAEVGPIKYIAQFVYGDDINKNLLERAVRWVIIILVVVFDPLAVCLILAVTMSLNRKNNETERQENTRDSSTGPKEETNIGKPEETTRTIEVVKEVMVQDHTRIQELTQQIDALLNEIKNRDLQIEDLLKPRWFPETFPTLIGKKLPDSGKIGQLYCLITPSGIIIYKWVGETWSKIDKEYNDSYLLEEPVLAEMLSMIESGELSRDQLSEKELEVLDSLSHELKFGRQ